MPGKRKIKKNKFLRVLAKIVIGLLLFFVAIILFIRSPWGQDIIVDRVVKYVSNKTGTEINIDRLFVTFSGNVFLEGLYLENEKGDTLVYSRELEASIALLPLIRREKINIKSVDWSGLNANIQRNEAGRFNFDFIVEAFATPPDTTQTASPELIIGTLDFNDFDVDYKDEFAGIQSSLQLGTLLLEVEETDFTEMIFSVGDAEITNSTIVYNQTKITTKEADTLSQAGVATLPVINVGELKIENVKAIYDAGPDQFFADVNITRFLLESPEMNLEEQILNLDNLELNDSDIVIRLPASNNTSTMDSIPAAPATFTWPEWNIDANKISLRENNILFQNGAQPPQQGIFDPQALEFTNLTFIAENILLNPENAKMQLEELSFLESGFNLNNLAFNLELNNTSLALSDLLVNTNKSSVNGTIQLDYQSIDHFLDNPEQATVKLNLPDFRIAMDEIFIFQPKLANNQYLNTLSQKDISGTIRLTGTLKQIQLAETNVQWGTTTAITVEGSVKDVLNPDQLHLDLQQFVVKTQKTDAQKFLPVNNSGIDIPDVLIIRGNLTGSLNDFKTTTVLTTPEGDIKVDGNFTNTDILAFDATLNVNSLELDKILKNPKLGTVTFVAKASGKGSGLNTLDATLESDFTKLEFNNYDFSNLSLSGNMKNGDGHIDLKYKDESLNLTGKINMKLDSVSPHYTAIIDVIGADLYTLGLTRQDIRTRFLLNAGYEGNTSDFSLSADITDGVAVYNNDAYNIGDFSVLANVKNDSTRVNVSSRAMDAFLISNSNPRELIAALKRHLGRYMSTDSIQQLDSVAKPATMELDMVIRQTPVLEEVFLQGLERLDTVTVAIDFKEAENALKAHLSAPFIKYQNGIVDSLYLDVNSDPTDLKFNLGWAGITWNPLTLKRTSFEGVVNNRTIFLDFNAFDENEMLAHIQSEIQIAQDTIQVHINPEDLLLNKVPWDISSGNQILMATKFIDFNDFTLSRNQQEIAVTTTITGQQTEHLDIHFENFRLSTFTTLLNPDDRLATGILKGKFSVNDPYGDSGIIAGLTIDSLKILEEPLGQLTIDATSKSRERYDFDLALKGGNADLDLTGDYIAAESGAQLNLDLSLNEVQVKTIEGFAENILSDTEGILHGNIKITGTTTNPEYEGVINFKDAGFVINSLNSKFLISEESLKLDNEGVYFDNFTIADTDKNTFELDGTIFTEQLTNPSFDMTIKADNFQAINATEGDNDLFYGKVNLSADLSVKGDLTLPVVNGSVQIREGANFTVIVPESRVDVIEREGVVIFVNRENPDAILTRTSEDESSVAILKGYDIDASIKVENDAVFNIIINERTGDNFQVKGEGDFNLSVEPNGRVSLAGRYVIEDGHYEASLYNLIKRRFDIVSGSTITWHGSPLEASLDVRALYNVETSAAPLMATQTSGESASIASRYQQELPFLVYLNVDGELLKPEISFNLDIPEDEQGALGGEVYGRVQQLNNQEEELNKQVFSLLVLNRFFPGSTSDGSAGGPASIARDNVNKVLSGQLNTFSDRIIGDTGVELDFGIDSYTDYQGESPEERTQLDVNASKRLFSDRLIVQVGSEVDIEGSSSNTQESTPIIGNVNIEYLLTENGRFRLKGFRRNEFESVIDGQLIVTGIAFIYNREFNRFRELWKKSIDEEVIKEEAEKGDKKNKKK